MLLIILVRFTKNLEETLMLSYLLYSYMCMHGCHIFSFQINSIVYIITVHQVFMRKYGAETIRKPHMVESVK